MNVNKININQSEPTYYIESGAYDVTANNNGAVFESLSTLLGSDNLNTLIPSEVRCGGMSIRFIRSSDNKYVQYRLMNQSFSTTESDWQGVDNEPTAGSENLVKSGGVFNSTKQIDSKVGTDDGVITDFATFTKGDTIFTNKDVNIGDRLYIEKKEGNTAPWVTLYDSKGVEILYLRVYPQYIDIPANFSYALVDYGSTGITGTFKVTNLSQLKYRVSKLEQRFSDTAEKTLYSSSSSVGTDDGLITDFVTFTKGDTIFTNKDVNIGDRLYIEKKEGDKAPLVTLYDDKGVELFYVRHYPQYIDIPANFSYALVDYGVDGTTGTFKVTNISQLKYRVSKLEGKECTIKSNDYGVVSAKLQLLSNDIHDVNEWVEIMSVASPNSKIKFMLKKAQTESYPDTVGVCPVPKYNAGICAGVAIDEVIWHEGYGLNWENGDILNLPDFNTEKCSLKMLVTFNSITVNTQGKDVRICWYFGEDNTKIQWTHYTSPLVNEVINVPSGANYFAISTQKTDIEASVKFDTFALNCSEILTPDGWNKNLLLGNDVMALRFSGDVTNSANQDIRLKIDDDAVTIYHSTDNSVIASYPKLSYNTAESIYNELLSLDNFSIEMLDINGVTFDDFIKCDVALVSQYNIEKQNNPGTIVTEWDSFPFYFTTKEKNGTYNFEVGIDYSDNNGKKIQAVLNGYPLYSSDDFADDFIDTPLTVSYGENINSLKENFNTNGDFYCPIRRMFYVEGMTEGNVNGTGGAAWTCRTKIEEAFDIMLRNNGHNVGYKEMMDEVLGDYKTSGNQFVFTSDDNGLSLYTSAEIRNMFARKGIHPATFFILNNPEPIVSNLSVIKACLNADYFCSIHSPYGYTNKINIGMLKYNELVDAVQQTFAKFVELFDRQPIVWDFHRDGESYNTVRYILNHGYKFIMGGGYAKDYGIISTITRYRIQRFGIRPDAQGQNTRMPDEWLFKKY